jgi:hypothetical protein
MTFPGNIAAWGLATLGLTVFIAAPARAQSPAVIAPIVVDTAVPIVVNAVKPKPPVGTIKFEGFVMNANIAQITVRAKGNDLSVQTFALSPEVSARMQAIVDKGGYQYGDKVTIYYDAATQQAKKIKGKPSKPA